MKMSLSLVKRSLRLKSMCAFVLHSYLHGGRVGRRPEGGTERRKKKKERKKRGREREREGGRRFGRSSIAAVAEASARDGSRRERERAMKRYLFWRPPSPPRSSEKFLQFLQHRLKKKNKEKSQRKGAQPHYHRVQKREGARLRDAGGVGRCGGAAGVAGRESDTTLFSPLLLMATNLIICLHSGAAETCSLTYTLSL